MLFIVYNTSGLRHFLALAIPILTLLAIYAFRKEYKIRSLISALIVAYLIGYFAYLFVFIKYLP